jgi:hypothetical protein
VSYSADDIKVDPWSRDRWEAIEGAAKDVCATSSLDALLVLGRSGADDFLAGTNQSILGVGFYVRGPGAIVSVMHVFGELGLIDCQTGKPLALRELARDQSGGRFDNQRTAPIQPVSVEVARQPVDEWTDEGKQEIRKDLIALPAPAWGPTLRSIFPTTGSGGH